MVPSVVLSSSGVCMIVYCFDRDGTVDTSAGPVPLDWVCRLAEHHPVYAIGNQALCHEADIPGVVERPDLAGIPDHVADPIRVARLREVEQRHPGATFVHVDDVDVGADDWDGWSYHSPRGFVDAVRRGAIAGIP